MKRSLITGSLIYAGVWLLKHVKAQWIKQLR